MSDGRAFEAAENFALLQRSVEDLCKDGGQLVSQEQINKPHWTLTEPQNLNILFIVLSACLNLITSKITEGKKRTGKKDM